MSENLIREYYIQLWNYICTLNSYIDIAKVHYYLSLRFSSEYYHTDVFDDHHLKLRVYKNMARDYAKKLSNSDLYSALLCNSLSEIVRCNKHADVVGDAFISVFDCQIDEGDSWFLPPDLW